jgi:hypothetical protein
MTVAGIRYAIRPHRQCTFVAALASGVDAQAPIAPPSQGGSIAAEVRDTAGQPMPGAPDRREVAYADDAGRFEVRLPNHPPWPLIVSGTGFRVRESQASRAHVAPMVIRLEPGERENVPETEILARTCACAGDFFTHQGR